MVRSSVQKGVHSKHNHAWYCRRLPTTWTTKKSINRFSSGAGSPTSVVKPGADDALTEFTLFYQEVIAITMDHSETNLRYDMTGKTGYIFDENVKKPLYYVKRTVVRVPKPNQSLPKISHRLYRILRLLQ